MCGRAERSIRRKPEGPSPSGISDEYKDACRTALAIHMCISQITTSFLVVHLTDWFSLSP